MIINNYIDQEIAKRDKQIKKIEKKQDKVKTACNMGTLFLGVLGLVLLAGPVSVALSSLALGVVPQLIKKEKNQVYTKKIGRLKREQKHYENIKDNGINGSVDLNRKRIAKIKSLENTQKKVAKQTKKSKFLNHLSLGVTVIPCILTSVIGPIALIPAAVGAILNVTNHANLQKNITEQEKITGRINNLKNDLHLLQKVEERGRTTSRQNVLPQTVITPKNMVNTKSLNNVRDKTRGNSLDLEQEKVDTLVSRPKQMIKTRK